MNSCPECYSDHPRATPLLKAKECLEQHTQYRCGTCGRCICIEKTAAQQLQRWQFPFKSFENARLYLRTAEISLQQPCGIYRLLSHNGREAYKIFPDQKSLAAYLKKSGKSVPQSHALWQTTSFKIFPESQIRRLTLTEVTQYLAEQADAKKPE